MTCYHPGWSVLLLFRATRTRPQVPRAILLCWKKETAHLCHTKVLYIHWQNMCLGLPCFPVRLLSICQPHPNPLCLVIKDANHFHSTKHRQFQRREQQVLTKLWSDCQHYTSLPSSFHQPQVCMLLINQWKLVPVYLHDHNHFWVRCTNSIA